MYQELGAEIEVRLYLFVVINYVEMRYAVSYEDGGGTCFEMTCITYRLDGPFMYQELGVKRC